MTTEFKLPDVGEGIHEATLVEWLVTEGGSVEADQPFVKVETDKAIVDIPSPVKAAVRKLHFNPGDVMHVGDVMVTLDGEGASAAPVPAGNSAVKAEQPAVQSAHTASSTAKQELGAAEPVRVRKGQRVLATPHTRSLARKMGVDIETITPSGKNGRITDEDVERAAEAPGKAMQDSPEAFVLADVSSTTKAVQGTVATAAPVADGEDVEVVPVTHLRKVIAENMVLSKHTAAHVTHVDEADVTELFSLYQKAKAQLADQGVKLTILPFFIKALVVALKAHPWLNSQYDEAGARILLKKFYNIGVAVDTPEGLMVPVLKGADRKDMVQIAQEIADMAARAQARRLTLDELRGGTFTVTNVGPMGGLFATPVIRYPEAAILGLHAMKERPAVLDGQVAVRKMMNLSLSFDHRIIDGMVAARFMTQLVELLQNPDLLMLRLL